jgi:hypothetical protein
MRQDMLREKLAYYEISDAANADIIQRVATFPKKDFVLDLRPFVPQYERDRLPGFFDLVQVQIKQVLKA